MGDGYDQDVYLIEIDYRTWKKIVKEQIEHLRKRFFYYVTRYSDADKYLKENPESWYWKVMHEYFQKMAAKTLDELIMMEDMYHYVSTNRDEYRYFIDFAGTIYVYLATPTTKKLFERKVPYIL